MPKNFLKIRDILLESKDIGAGDVNITVDENLTLRIKGKMVKYPMIHTRTLVNNFVDELTGATEMKSKVFTGEAIDGSYILDDKYYYRYNICRAGGKIHITIRNLIDSVPSYEMVQLDKPNIKPFIDKMRKVPPGMFLLVGATGSGKTTTIVTLLDTILKEKSLKTITLEAPIEYYFNPTHYKESLIIQREVGLGKDVPTFYNGLVDAMRQNPDVIFVGEIRDVETAEAARQAALSGHMVIATLHAKSVVETKERMKGLLKGVANNFDFIEGIAYQKLEFNEETQELEAVRDIYVREQEN